ncbi:MAG: hypothetical protein RIC03_04520 [Cyclobacteriaceae bacterium]
MKNSILYIVICLFLISCADDDDFSDLFKDTVDPSLQHEDPLADGINNDINNNGVIIRVDERPDHFQFLEQLRGASRFQLKSSSVPNAVQISESGIISVYDPSAFDYAQNATIDLVVLATSLSGETQQKEVPITIIIEEAAFDRNAVTLDNIVDRFITISTIVFQKDTTGVKFTAHLENQIVEIYTKDLPKSIDETKQYFVSPTVYEDEAFAQITVDKNTGSFDYTYGQYGYINITRGDLDVFEVTLENILLQAPEEEGGETFDFIDEYTFNAVDRSGYYFLESGISGGNISLVSTFEEVDGGANIQFAGGFLTIPKGSTSGTYQITNTPTTDLSANQAAMNILITGCCSSRRYVGESGSVDLTLVDGMYIFELGNISVTQTFPPGSNEEATILSGTLRY